MHPIPHPDGRPHRHHREPAERSGHLEPVGRAAGRLAHQDPSARPRRRHRRRRLLEICAGHKRGVRARRSGNVDVSFFAGSSGFAHQRRVYAIDQRQPQPARSPNPAGPYLPGWPVKVAIFAADLLPTVGHGVSQGAALADVDGDGKDEVIVQGNNGRSTSCVATARRSTPELAHNYVTLDYDVSLRLPPSPSPSTSRSSSPVLGNRASRPRRRRQPRVIAAPRGRSSYRTSSPARQGPAITRFRVELDSGHLISTYPRIIEDLMVLRNPALSMSTAMGCRRSCRGARALRARHEPSRRRAGGMAEVHQRLDDSRSPSRAISTATSAGGRRGEPEGFLTCGTSPAPTERPRMRSCRSPARPAPEAGRPELRVAPARPPRTDPRTPSERPGARRSDGSRPLRGIVRRRGDVPHVKKPSRLAATTPADRRRRYRPRRGSGSSSG